VGFAGYQVTTMTRGVFVINMNIKVEHYDPGFDRYGNQHPKAFDGVGKLISFVGAGSVRIAHGSGSGYDEIYAMVLADNRIHCVRYNELEVVND